MRKHAELMENYHEAYRLESLPLLENMVLKMTQGIPNAEDSVNLDIQRKKLCV